MSLRSSLHSRDDFTGMFKKLGQNAVVLVRDIKKFDEISAWHSEAVSEAAAYSVELIGNSTPTGTESQVSKGTVLFDNFFKLSE